MNKHNEIWKPVPTFEGFYEASSLGRVKSLPRVIQRKNGTRQTIHGKIMSPALDSYGYLQCKLSKPRNNVLWFVHKIIAVTFIGEAPSGEHEINHLDGDKLNNCVANLEWVTHLENVSHGVSLGLFKRNKYVLAEEVAK